MQKEEKTEKKRQKKETDRTERKERGAGFLRRKVCGAKIFLKLEHRKNDQGEQNACVFFTYIYIYLYLILFIYIYIYLYLYFIYICLRLLSATSCGSPGSGIIIL